MTRGDEVKIVIDYCGEVERAKEKLDEIQQICMERDPLNEPIIYLEVNGEKQD